MVNRKADMLENTSSEESHFVTLELVAVSDTTTLELIFQIWMLKPRVVITFFVHVRDFFFYLFICLCYLCVHLIRLITTHRYLKELIFQ